MYYSCSIMPPAFTSLTLLNYDVIQLNNQKILAFHPSDWMSMCGRKKNGRTFRRANVFPVGNVELRSGVSNSCSNMSFLVSFQNIISYSLKLEL